MGGEVKQVAVDLTQVLHLVLQLSHTDPQLVLAAQHALGRGGAQRDSSHEQPRPAPAPPSRGPAHLLHRAAQHGVQPLRPLQVAGLRALQRKRPPRCSHRPNGEGGATLTPAHRWGDSGSTPVTRGLAGGNVSEGDAASTPHRTQQPSSQICRLLQG